MATVKNYTERVPPLYQHRYNSRYWIDWANALLERLSGAGFLPPQLLTCGAEVHNKVWINRPPMSRDIKEVRCSQNQSYTYRFAEENNRLRLLDARFPETSSKYYVLEIVASGPGFVRVTAPDLAENFLKGWLFVIADGTAAGHTFIVGSNETADTTTHEANVYFLNPHDFPTTDDINAVTPTEVQMSFYTDADVPFASEGYFVAPRNYVILYYVAKFRPVTSVVDDLGIDGYENLVDAWFRWKVEEQISAISQECKYWYARVEEELAQLRAEISNRMNKARGRTLAGFGR